MLKNNAKVHNVRNSIVSALDSIPERQYKNAQETAKETYLQNEDLLRDMDSFKI